MKHLKILLLASSLATLSGCAAYDAFNMAGYDNNEYLLATQVRTAAELSTEACEYREIIDRNLIHMNTLSLTLVNYTEHLPNNQEANDLAAKLHKLVTTTYDAYDSPDVSVGYCKAKMNLIEKNAASIQEALGGKPQ